MVTPPHPRHSGDDRLSDAGELHAAGYTTRMVHARWCLESFHVLHELFTDGGEPLTATGPPSDLSYMLSVEEWERARRAAQTISDLAGIVGWHLQLEKSPE